MNAPIEDDLHELVNQARDSARENEVIRKLREVSEDDAFTHIEFLLGREYPGTFDVARRVISNNDLKARLVRDHMPGADASNVKFFLRFAQKALPKKVLQPLLVEMCKSDSGLWERCSYWLPSIIGKEDAVFVADEVQSASS